jgi:tetratricopeptide (TPR) repeat protein
MAGLAVNRFKIGYAATAMPARLALEQHDWDAAQHLEQLPGTAPQVTAIVYWARALGHARATVKTSADADIAQLQACLDALNAKGDTYWAAETRAMLKSAQGWRFAAQGDAKSALASLRAAADEEDGLEKLPVTPGPIIPAREQLGELLLILGQPKPALSEFRSALALAPARRGALMGAIAAANELGDTETVTRLRASLK